MATDEMYMHRCIELARKGAGYVAPNPMVGAVLVKEGKIIGEGWHQQYGQAHAEVNACAVLAGNFPAESSAGTVLYVSLEPCAHFGKTPPCADLIILLGIPKVVIGCRDPFPAVNGKGIEKLKAAGVEVVTGVLEKECRELNKRFFTFHEKKRPWIILKWAQTADIFIGSKETEPRLLITGNSTNRLVHQWRSEEAAILVGTKTVLQDNPSLTTRLYPGPSPVRMVLDGELKLPATLNLFDGTVCTIVWNYIRDEEKGNIKFVCLKRDEPFIPRLLEKMYELNLQSLIVEGGRNVLQQFIDGGWYDEARVITNTSMFVTDGIPAPSLDMKKPVTVTDSGNEKIEQFINIETT